MAKKDRLTYTRYRGRPGKALPTTPRPCPFCRQPHHSTGPGDRYHPECRHRVHQLDNGTVLYFL